MKFKNTKRGFVGILVLLLAIIATGGGVYVYQKNKIKTDIDGNYSYPATSTTKEETEANTSVKITAPATVKVEANTQIPAIDSSVNTKKLSQLKYIGSRYGFNYPPDWSIWDTGNDSVIIYPSSKSEELRSKILATSERIEISVIDKKEINITLAQQVVLNGTTWYIVNRDKTGVEYYRTLNNEKYIAASTGISNKATLEIILSSLITG